MFWNGPDQLTIWAMSSKNFAPTVTNLDLNQWYEKWGWGTSDDEVLFHFLGLF